MLNHDVFCRDTTIFVNMFVPYNAFKGNNSKKLTGLEIFLKSLRTVREFFQLPPSRSHRSKIFKNLKLYNQCLIPTYFVEIQRFL
jgi:hypothetical protein